MLKLRASLTVWLVLGGLLALAPPSHADDPAPVCVRYDPQLGTCLIWAGGGGGGGTGPGGGVNDAATGGGGGGDSNPMIQINGSWCFPAGLASPQPPKTDPIWKGHTDGAIYLCEVSATSGRGGLLVAPITLQYWALAAPPPPPDPQVLARRAVASMTLSAITIGMVPEPVPGRVGLVGMPNWMWVQDPTQHTWGPITRSASAGGWTVTATARVAQVMWDMGDGQVVSCGAGTPYVDSYGKAPSPTCGHVYTRQGRYTVRATSHWVITWAGIGQAGTITMDLSQNASVTIGEAQVLKQ